MKNRIITFLLITITYFSSWCVAGHYQADTAPTITIDRSVLENFNFDPDHLDFSSNNEVLYNIIAQEIAALKKKLPKFETIPFSENNPISQEAQKLAPKLYDLLLTHTEKLVKKAKIALPKLYLYVGTEASTYNASAQKQTITTTKIITHTDGSVKEEKTEQESYKLTIGQGLLQLYCWRREHSNYLVSIEAHEIGHIYFKHGSESVKCEMEADMIATKITDKPGELIPALFMATLAAQMYKELQSHKNSTHFSTEYRHEIVRKVVNLVMRKTTNLNKLGQSKSHTHYASLIAQAMSDALKSLSNKETTLKNVYKKIMDACDSPSSLIGVNNKEFGDECKRAESHTVHTHPPTAIRQKFILRCLATPPAR